MPLFKVWLCFAFFIIYKIVQNNVITLSLNYIMGTAKAYDMTLKQNLLKFRRKTKSNKVSNPDTQTRRKHRHPDAVFR